ncbi:beige/beach-related [Anaeramoeba flamelloides]|uniref:Beige/beach-related n=1 Tax=Anaeramoeba flamelloides TaxID=1746091 RepID=A0AAV7YPU4_9EUKA|nr:beige/beach-related [Anaeramoeba flamelloides]
MNNNRNNDLEKELHKNTKLKKIIKLEDFDFIFNYCKQHWIDTKKDLLRERSIFGKKSASNKRWKLNKFEHNKLLIKNKFLTNYKSIDYSVIDNNRNNRNNKKNNNEKELNFYSFKNNIKYYDDGIADNLNSNVVINKSSSYNVQDDDDDDDDYDDDYDDDDDDKNLNNIDSIKKRTNSKTKNDQNNDNQNNNNNNLNKKLKILIKKKKTRIDKRILRRLDILDQKKKEKIEKFPCGIIINYKFKLAIILLCKHYFYIMENFGLSKNKKFIDLRKNKKINFKTRKYNYININKIFKRKKIGEDISLECKFNNGNHIFLILSNQLDRDKIFKFLLLKLNLLLNNEISTNNKNRNDNNNSGNGSKSRNVNNSNKGNNNNAIINTNKKKRKNKNLDLNSIKKIVYLSFKIKNKNKKLKLVKDLFEKVNKLSSKWKNNQISNFNYLMKLNFLAGRSFNDLNKYPIFPWIFKDYQSKLFDLNDSNRFRDLSKPMGILNEERFKIFLENYNSWEDIGGKIPKFHYGSHYSTYGSVLFFLVRLEPFSKLYFDFQGGKFDKPGRLFQSIERSFLHSSELSFSDVKELIPEFFYMPDFLINQNKFDFGKLETNNKQVNHVELPPWAHGNAYEFINKHRMALESEYVSQHLNEWIDLIFGYKQQGEEAIKSGNVFYYLTYENLNSSILEKIKDPIQKKEIILHMESFGQCPTQIFFKPHPKKKVINQKKRNLFNSPESLQIGLFKNISKEIDCIKIINNKIEKPILIEKGFLLFGKKNKKNKIIQWKSDDDCIRIFNHNLTQIYGSIEYPHYGEISSVSISKDDEYLATAGSDFIVNLWEISKMKKNNERPDYTNNTKLKMNRNNKSQFDHKYNFDLIGRLFGHNSLISCIQFSKSFGIVVSGSIHGCCIVWDLYKAKYLNSFTISSKEKIKLIRINQLNGQILLCSDHEIAIWSINGIAIASTIIASHNITSAHIAILDHNSLEFGYVTGHQDGRIRFWKLINCFKRKNSNRGINKNKKKPKRKKNCDNNQNNIENLNRDNNRNNKLNLNRYKNQNNKPNPNRDKKRNNSMITSMNISKRMGTSKCKRRSSSSNINNGNTGKSYNKNMHNKHKHNKHKDRNMKNIDINTNNEDAQTQKFFELKEISVLNFLQTPIRCICLSKDLSKMYFADSKAVFDLTYIPSKKNIHPKKKNLSWCERCNKVFPLESQKKFKCTNCNKNICNNCANLLTNINNTNPDNDNNNNNNNNALNDNSTKNKILKNPIKENKKKEKTDHIHINKLKLNKQDDHEFYICKNCEKLNHNNPKQIFQQK